MTEVAYWALEVTPEDEDYAGSVISLDERPDYYLERGRRDLPRRRG
jgi:hypothetical protein